MWKLCSTLDCQSNESVVYSAWLSKWNPAPEAWGFKSCRPAALAEKAAWASARRACGALGAAACDSWGGLVHGGDSPVEMVFKEKGKRPSGCFLSKTSSRVLAQASNKMLVLAWSRHSERWWRILWSCSHSALSTQRSSFGSAWSCGVEAVRDTQHLTSFLLLCQGWYRGHTGVLSAASSLECLESIRDFLSKNKISPQGPIWKHFRCFYAHQGSISQINIYSKARTILSLCLRVPASQKKELGSAWTRRLMFCCTFHVVARGQGGGHADESWGMNGLRPMVTSQKAVLEDTEPEGK